MVVQRIDVDMFVAGLLVSWLAGNEFRKFKGNTLLYFNKFLLFIDLFTSNIIQ